MSEHVEKKANQAYRSNDREANGYLKSEYTAVAFPAVAAQYKAIGNVIAEADSEEKETKKGAIEEKTMEAPPIIPPILPKPSADVASAVAAPIQAKSELAAIPVAPIQLKTSKVAAPSLTPPPFQFKSASIEEAMDEDAGFESKIKADPVSAPRNQSSNSTGLPLAVQAKMEGAMGADFSDVNIHQDSQSATEVGALAYAQGNDVHFASGQYNPESSAGQELIGHELAHVVQQREGRVQPTAQAKGLPVNDDKGLEAEADAKGRNAAQMNGVVDMTIQKRADRAAYSAGRSQHESRGTDTADDGTSPSVGTSFSDTGEAPVFRHDHGHLDDGHGNLDPSLMQEPTMGDRLSLLRWQAMLEGAELLRPDLIDATRAYRHFLQGEGSTYTFDYERFIENDSSGTTVMASVVEDALNEVRHRHEADLNGDFSNATDTSYSFRSDLITVGGDSRYPYPATENWQKAIGGHPIWFEVEANIQIISRPLPTMPSASSATNFRIIDLNITLHVEDMYNFNPGQQDIASGAADAVNGRFEITGLGHEFLQTSSTFRNIQVTEPLGTAPSSPDAGTAQSIRPPSADSRGRRRAEGGSRDGQ